MTEQQFFIALSERLQQIRKKKGTRQTQLADLLGVNKSFVGQVESQGEKISAFRLNQWLEHTGNPSLLTILDQLVSGEEKKTSKLTLNVTPA